MFGAIRERVIVRTVREREIIPAVWRLVSI